MIAMPLPICIRLSVGQGPVSLPICFIITAKILSMEIKQINFSLLTAVCIFLFFTSVLHAQVGLSVSPPRVYYTLGEGESGSQKVLVSNLSKEHMLNISFTFGDWKYDDRGNNLMFPPDTLDNSCASWLSLPGGTYINLEPAESREIDLMMTVPSILQETDNVQTAMLYVTQMNPVDGVDAKGAAIKINVRQGIKIYRKGLQPETKQLEIVNMTLDRERDIIGLEFINSGNAWVNGTLKATLFNRATGKEIALDETVYYTMPGDRRLMDIPLKDKPEKGEYTATVMLDYGDDNTLEAAELEFTYE